MRLFLAYRATTRALLFAPYILYFVCNVRGMSFAEYSLLQGLYYLVVVVAEVPSGVVADRLGRKATLLLGALVNAAGCFAFAAAHDMLVFVAGEILFALGTALVSGADSALLYDSLAADNREHEYPRAEGAAQASWLILTAVGLPLTDRFLVRGGDPVLAYWFTGAFSLVGAACAAFLVEPPVERRLSTREITLGALRDVVSIPGILRMVLYSVGVFALLRAAIVMFFNPALEAARVPVNWFGTTLAVVNIVGAVTAWKAHRWLERFGERAVLAAMPLSLIVMVAALIAFKMPAAALLFCIQGAVFGAYPLTTRSILNRLVPGAERRATTLSIESLACRIAFVPLVLFSGWGLEHLGLDGALAATTGLACLPFLVMWLLPRAR